MSKPKTEMDEKLTKSLEETFPASDPPAANVSDVEPVRPVGRKPPKIDMNLVNHLAEKVSAEIDAQKSAAEATDEEKKNR